MALVQPQPNTLQTFSHDQSQLEHAAELARLLVRHLGIDGAARTCRENHWDGVLTEVLNHDRAAVAP